MKSQKVQSNPENIFIVKYQNGRKTLNHTQKIIEFCLKSMQVGPSVSKWVSQLVSQSDGQSVSQLDSQVISPSVSQLDGRVISQSGGETIRHSVRQLDSQVISQSFSKTIRWSVRQSSRQAGRQAGRQSVSQSVAQPVTWSTRKSLSQSVCQYIYSSLSQPVCQLLNQRVNHFADKWSAQLETALIEGDVYFNKVMLLFLKNWNIHNKSETCSNTIHCLFCLWKWACVLQWLALPFQNNREIIVNAPFYCNHLTIKILFCRRKFQGLAEKVTRLLHTKWSLEEYS